LVGIHFLVLVDFEDEQVVDLKGVKDFGGESSCQKDEYDNE
jgi:hypothetical protein